MKVSIFAIILNISLFFIGCSDSTPNKQNGEFKQIDSLPVKNKIEVSIPESYELSNIILALTNYGKTDKWEVEKNTDYYKEILIFFEPVKHHPLLQKANYSRDLWENYLSFRTDACAYEIDSLSHLKRMNDFHAVEGHNAFDQNEKLINDFIIQSNFRSFYKSHQPLYNSVISKYSSYYMLNEMRDFFDKEIGLKDSIPDNFRYKIILSPLVGRMNCHREIDSITTADFPNIAIALLKGDTSKKIDQVERAMEIHTIFTEMDHGYVNPMTDKYESEVKKNFHYKMWDIGSGYEELDCFNEYMTWGLYDIFLDKYFPKYADSLSIQWHYQNASRGFYASDFFAKQLRILYNTKKEDEKLEDLYPKLLNYCASAEKIIQQPKIILTDKSSVIQKNGQIELHFNIDMKKDIDKISCQITKLEGGKPAKEFKMLTLTPNNFVKCASGKDVVLKFESGYKDYEIIFNWWGCKNPLFGANNIMLAPYTVIKVKSL